MTQPKPSLGDLAFRAEGGDVSAQYRLGVAFLLGELAEQDTDAAYRWLVRAAVGGNEGARALVERLIAGNLVSLEENNYSNTGSPVRGKQLSTVLRRAFGLCSRATRRILWPAYARIRMGLNRASRARFAGTRLQPEAEPLQAAPRGDQAVQFQHPS